MSTFFYQVVLAGGGAAVICGGILLALWRLSINSLLERFKRSQAEALERLKSELELNTMRTDRFETAQFGAFQGVWNKLADLRVTSNRLWQEATQQNIADFGHSLEEAHRVVYGAQLIIDGGDLHRLRGVLHELEEFYKGKEGLIRLRQATPNDHDAIDRRIAENGHIRDRFIDAIEDLRVSIQRQILRAAPNDHGA